MTAHAVAVDLGATSVRYAAGTLEDERIDFQIVEQQTNAARDVGGHPCWDIEFMLTFCQAACAHAAALSPEATVGIDSWGVDHGFIGTDGRLVQPPACYRDPLHQAVFEELSAMRSRLYQLTGIAHQPFNTFYQLIARARQNPSLPSSGARWLILPDLILHLLGAEAGYERTQASTTQLMGLDGKWCQEAFDLAGWPAPPVQPEDPGQVAGKAEGGTRIVRVGSHDTASAVAGLGTLEDDEAFLNAGTWSLLGCILEKPLVNPEAEAANFSNEWTVDGRIRFLKNIPGFYVINRLHEELHVGESVPDWISRADQSYGARIDLFNPEFFNPPSMLEAVRNQIEQDPPTPEAWAGLALMSLAEGASDQLHQLEKIVGRKFAKIRLAGGGSNSRAFCEALANVTGRAVLAGPAEATVLGNLGAQFLAQGLFASWDELGAMLRRSLRLQTYFPGV
jgi:rhamnulokinase